MYMYVLMYVCVYVCMYVNITLLPPGMPGVQRQPTPKYLRWNMTL